ncbi:unnamed protein product [Leptosia nina]|uniref:Secreted protein n=1 Tax=Leptosia nina TaxID=320188 RepID=A0AAV1J0P9_9NEOP
MALIFFSSFSSLLFPTVLSKEMTIGATIADPTVIYKHEHGNQLIAHRTYFAIRISTFSPAIKIRRARLMNSILTCHDGPRMFFLQDKNCDVFTSRHSA